MTRLRWVKGADGAHLGAWEYGAGSSDGDPTAAARPGVLLLHGPLGSAAAWWRTAAWLAPRFRVVALEGRGRAPGRPLAPDEPTPGHAQAVADAEAAVEQLGLGPALVVGHGHGARAAWRLATVRPDLVAGVVAAEMRCAPLTEPELDVWRRWLAAWPLPFASLAAAREWFAEHDPALEFGPSPGRGEFFAELLEHQGDGYRPAYPPERILDELAAAAHQAHWDELPAVPRPMLVVRGLRGDLGRAEAQEMVKLLPLGSYAEVPGAGHLLHLEEPSGWRRATEPFLLRAAESLPLPD